jgi:nicotinate-nucleotide--dimethylbenzimidazole phosphoribosyltransferase
MKSLEELRKLIGPSDRGAFEECRKRFDFTAKPVGGLGRFEELTEKIAAVQGSADIDIRKKCVLAFCADNGVADRGVTQSRSDVTTAVAGLMVRGTSSVCIMAKSCGADVFPVDIGMRKTFPGIRDERLGAGTGDISEGPAMTRETALRGIETGADLVREMKEKGYRLIAAGENGMGNTTTSGAMAAVMLGIPVSDAAGRGAGLSDEGLALKREIIERAVRINAPDASDPVDILTKLGGFDIAGMTGVFLGGAAYRVPIVMDGLISSVAALTAAGISPDVKDYIIPSHISAEPAARIICEKLGVRPVLHAEMHLGEGTGAVALFPLLDMAAAVLKDAATYDDL